MPHVIENYARPWPGEVVCGFVVAAEAGRCIYVGSDGQWRYLSRETASCHFAVEALLRKWSGAVAALLPWSG